MCTLIVALSLAILFRSFVYEPFRIPSASMYPTLKINDFIMVSKYSYGYSKHSLPWSLPVIPGRIFFSQPDRGDIVVFKIPEHPKRFFVKRLIGLPGDNIQMKRGSLYINNKLVELTDEIEVTHIEKNFGSTVGMVEYNEILPNGKVHKIWKKGEGYVDNRSFPNTTRKYTVPAEHYFFMGDNRDQSVDSRYTHDIGLIHRDNLLGRVSFMHMSFNDIKRSFSRL